jgi:cyclohexanecarboxylate-CoA ligase
VEDPAPLSGLRASYRHPRAAEYRAPGGAWDVPTLDALLGGGPPSIAGALRAMGVRRGSVVAWQAPNWPEVGDLYRACWRLGAVAAPIHHQAGDAEVAGMLDALRPALFLPRDELRERVARARGSLHRFTGSHSRPSDLAVVLFTGGSTGEPKAVLHTHRSLAHKAVTMTRVHGLTADDVVLMPAPLAHVSGLLNGVLVPGAAGMRTVLMERWDPERALALIERERVSFMIGPPTFFRHLMDAPGFTAERVRSLRLVSSGGAGVTPAFVEEATERLGARVKRSYGSTEAPTLTSSTDDDPFERARDTDGRVAGQAELRIAADGELLVRGPELFTGYLDPAQTRAAVTRGWLHTGDLASIDDGWLTITGRKKDVIIRGGENISAGEVEHVLEAHPAVRQAVAVGYPDDVMGERVCAFVLTDGPFDLESCRAWFAERGVARFKTPERIEVVDAFPLLAAGKVDRNALRVRLTH